MGHTNSLARAHANTHRTSNLPKSSSNLSVFQLKLGVLMNKYGSAQFIRTLILFLYIKVLFIGIEIYIYLTKL